MVLTVGWPLLSQKQAPPPRSVGDDSRRQGSEEQLRNEAPESFESSKRPKACLRLIKADVN
jgi:hypothetical protein